MSMDEVFKWEEERKKKIRRELKKNPLLTDKQIEEMIAEGYQLENPDKL